MGKAKKKKATGEAAMVAATDDKARAPAQAIDFDALTERERDVLGHIAIQMDGGHHPRVLASLEAKGLIVSYKEDAGGFPPMTVTRYDVPLPVHMLWCQWCSDNCPDDDEALK